MIATKRIDDSGKAVLPGRKALMALTLLLLTGVVGPALSGQTLQAEPAESIPLILRPWGFEPQDLTLPAGLTAFRVYNRTGVRELDLRFEREEEGPEPGTVNRVLLKQELVSRDRRKWREVQDLEAGTYVLREENHPKWTCRITVEAGRK